MIASALDSPTDCWNLARAEEKLINAAKARIRRMVEEKKLGLIWQPQSGCSRSGGKEPNRKIRWHSAFKR